MNIYRIDIATDRNLTISCNNKTWGTQGDFQAGKFVWEVPEAYRGYTTKLKFHTDDTEFKPVFLKETEYILTPDLTQGTSLYLSIAFVDEQEKEIANSNIIEGALRPNRGDGNTILLAQEVQDNLTEHAKDAESHVTAEKQTAWNEAVTTANAAIPGAEKGKAEGVAELGPDGKVPSGQLPDLNYDPEGSAQEVQDNLTEHAKDTELHVTAEKQAAWNGAVTTANAAIPAAEKGQAEGVAELGPDGKVPSGQLPELNYDPAGSAQAVQSNLNEHVNDAELHVTAEKQTAWNGAVTTANAAIPAAEKGQAEGVAELGPDGKVPSGQLPELNYDPAGSAQAVQSNLNEHVNDAELHVTAEKQAAWNGAVTTANAAIPAAEKGQAEGVAELGPDGKVPSGQLPELNYDPAGSAQAVQSNLNEHVNDAELHVTAEKQAAWNGAVTTANAAIPAAEKGQAEGVAELGPDGKVPSGQLPELNYDPAGSAQAVQSNLNEHVNDAELHVTAEKQAAWNGAVTTANAAIPAAEKGQAEGVAELGPDGKVPSGQLPELNYDPAGSAQAVQSNLNEHVNDAELHVTAEKQAAWNEAVTTANAAIPAAEKGQAEGVAELGPDGKVPSGQLPELNYDPAGTAAGAVNTHDASTTAHPDVRSALSEHANEIEILKLTYLTDVTGNQFAVMFEDLSTASIDGIWNRNLGRVEF